MEAKLQAQVDRFFEENKDADRGEVDRVKSLFALFDRDMSGDLDAEEVTAMFEKLGKPKNALEVRKEIAKWDKNKSGSIDLYEYLCMTLGGGASPFMKTLLFFKELELKNAAEAEAAKDPRKAFLANKGK